MAVWVCCQGAAESLPPSIDLLWLRKGHPHKQGCLGWQGPQDMNPSWMELSRAPEKALRKRAPSKMAVRSDPAPCPTKKWGSHAVLGQLSLRHRHPRSPQSL